MAELPVMPIKTVTGPEYMDALARLGYNVENMTSPLPIISKIAEAGSNMLDRAYQQNMEYQQAQGRLALSKAQADHLDSETAYNNRTADARAKTLDYDAQIKQRQAEVANATIDQAIEAEKNRLTLLPQIQQNEADKAKNDAQRSKLELDGQANAQRMQKEGIDDLPLAMGELPHPGDPDFYPKIAAARSHHGAAMLDPFSSKRFEDEVKARTDIHERMASTMAQNKDQQEIIAQHDKGYIDDATFANVNQLVNDPVARHRVLAKSRVTQATMDVNDLLAEFPRDPAEIAALPPLIQQQRTELLQMANDMRPLSTDDGLERVVGGNHLDLFDQNGNLNPKLKGDMSALRTWLTERQKQAAAKGMGATEITIRVPNPEDPTKFLREFKTTVPTDQLQETLQSFQQQGLQATPTGQETPQQKQAVQAGTSTTLQRMAAQDPAIQNLLIQAGQQGNKEARDELRRRYQAAVRGMQEGGTVTQSGTSDAPSSTDTVPAMLTPGEFVINADAARNIGQPALDRMNRTGTPQMRPIAGSSLPTLPMPTPPQTRQQAQPPRVDVSRGYAREAAPSQTPAVTTGPATIPGVEKTTGGLSQVGSNIGGAQITHYGYLGDANWDTASGMGKGDAGWQARGVPMQAGFSVALTQGMRSHLFPGANPATSTGRTFQWGGQTYRDDDTAPEAGYRIDVYDPHYSGLDKGVTPEMVDLRRRQTGLATQTYQYGGTVTDPTLALDTSQGVQDASTMALLASQSAAAQMGPAGYQRGGFVGEGEMGGGMGGELGGRGGGGELGGRGTGGELGDPIQQQTRHRRFRPRLPGQQRIMGPTIPDEMQRKLAKLSHDYLSGLSGLIQSKPEIGPALIRHARNQLAANMGAPGEEEQMQQQQPTLPSEGQQFSPAQYAMTSMMGEET